MSDGLELLGWVQLTLFTLLRLAVGLAALGVLRRHEPRAGYAIAGGAALSIASSCGLRVVYGSLLLDAGGGRPASDLEETRHWVAVTQCSQRVLQFAFFALVAYGLVRAAHALRVHARREPEQPSRVGGWLG